MWSPGGPPGPAGWDRRRVGARLRAALAGLQELQGLRARQQALVRGALAVQPPSAARRAPRAPELRLEAALAALQDQLNHLRRQDVGLKTQLDRLDRRISELQLDMRRKSAEGRDSDSRPSSGFYELSDGGSCSPSASCTSVCSDRLSSSLGTLLPAAPLARPSAGASRPWSADETTVCGGPLPVWGWPAAERRAGQPPRGMARPRPVSTGDLDRVLPAEAGFPKADADARSTSLLCHGLGLPPHALDPKYQRDLVSKGGGEVYPFPSPLHAVALQSPLFALTKETPQGDSHLPPPSKSPPSPSGPGPVRTGPVLTAGSAQAYIDKLLGLRGQRNPIRGSVGEQGPPGYEVSLSQRAESGGCPESLTCSPRRADTGGGSQKRGTGRSSLEQWGPLVGPPHPSSLSEDGHKPSSGCVRVGAILGSPQLGGESPSSCSWAELATPEDWRGKARPPTKTPRPCVHPESVASGAALMGLKMGQKTAYPLTKAVRMGRGACDRAPGSGRQPPPWGALLAPQRPPTWGAWLRGRPAQAGEAPGRSCSESSLYPVSFLVPLLVASREGYRASAQALFPLEAAPPARRRQRRWRSSVEIAAGVRPAGAQGPAPGPPRPATRRGAGLRPACSRARPRPPRRDTPAGSVSGGSEHSAECASLVHSTIAETSGDEASDHTANCFGDQESGGSDAEDSVQGTGGRPWQPPRAPACPRPPLPSAPRLCRVKASKALKKKIRRFQPAALKVMTLV